MLMHDRVMKTIRELPMINDCLCWEQVGDVVSDSVLVGDGGGDTARDWCPDKDPIRSR